MATTTTTQIDPAVQDFYDGNLLARAKPYLPHALFGQQRPVDLKSGNRAKFRRYANFAASTAPLVEGVTPTALQLTKTDITATLYQYGAYTEYTDVVTFVNEDPVLTELSGVLGDHAGLSLDTVYRDILNAGSSVLYANSVGGRSSIVTKVADADFRKINRALGNANAKHWDKVIKASTGVGTSPVRASWICLCHPDVTYDLEALSGWVSVAQYPDPSIAHENEVGAYKNFRFIESTNCKIWPDTGGAVGVTGCKSTTGSNLDIYSILCFAQNAYGITPLKGKALENIIKGLGEGDDPLNQRGTSGWKAMTTAVILNDTWMYRYEVAVTA